VAKKKKTREGERDREENARVDAKCCGIPKILERRKHLTLLVEWSPPPPRERERERTPLVQSGQPRRTRQKACGIAHRSDGPIQRCLHRWPANLRGDIWIKRRQSNP
jgi:hypothetical protein